MKKLILGIALVATSIFLFNFKFTDGFSEFGETQQEAASKFLTALQSPYLSAPYLSSTVKNACQVIPSGNQAFAVEKIGSLLKYYYSTDDFKKRYSLWVKSTFLETGKMVSEERKKEIKQNSQINLKNLEAKDITPLIDIQIQSGEQMAEMEPMIKNLPVEQRAEFKKQMEAGKRTAALFKEIKHLLTSDFEEFKRQYAAYLAEEQIANEEHTAAEAFQKKGLEYDKWKDPKTALTIKLNEFLDLTKAVDFSAQTKTQYNQKKFVNPAYESKSNVWKLCYRIGETPTNAARAYAQNWLKELK